MIPAPRTSQRSIARLDFRDGSRVSRALDGAALRLAHDGPGAARCLLRRQLIARGRFRGQHVIGMKHPQGITAPDPVCGCLHDEC